MNVTGSPFARWMAHGVITALAYFLLGKLSLLLAIPPAFASPIWPAAGVAMASAFVFGYRMWPAVLVGAFAVNIAPSWDDSTTATIASSIGMTLVGSLGAALQAVVGAWLMRRLVDLNGPFDRLGQVLRCQVQVAALGCIISPTIAVTSRAVAGMAPWSEYPSIWATWWMGDAIGVLVAVPLVLIWVTGDAQTIRRRLTVALPLGLVLLATGLCFLNVRDSDWQVTRARFEHRTQGLAEQLRKTLNEHLNEIHAINGLFRASDTVDRHAFAAFVGPRLDALRSVEAFAWIPAVPHSQRAEFEEAARRDGLSGYQFTERGGPGEMVRAADRPEYYPAYFVEPLARNEVALGFDVATNPRRYEALELARDTGRLVASAQITLVSEMKNRNGFLAFSAVYEGGVTPATVELRRDRLEGFCLGVFDVQHLVTASLAGVTHHDVSMMLTDESSGHPETLITLNPPASDDSNSAAGWSNAPFQSTQTLELGGRRWSCLFLPTDLFLASHQSWGAWIVIVFGFLFSGLLGTTLMVATGREVIVRRLVEEKTHQLTVTNSQLAQKNAEMEQFVYTASHDLKSPIVTIRGYTGFLKSDFREGRFDRFDQFTDRILDASHSMRENIDDLLELSRVGRVALEPAVVDLETMTRSILADLESLVTESGADITIRENLPEVMADGSRLRQVLQNLLENALKYGRPEDGTPQITLDAEAVDGEIRVFVADNGPGISPDYHESIFGLFKRLDSDMEGTGVGLAIVKRVAEVHGGRAWVESEPGAGTTFYVALPQDPPTEPIARAA